MNEKTIAIIGAGQMGGGIAQVAAAAGFKVLLCDAFASALGKCQDMHRKRYASLVEKQKMTQEEMNAAIARIQYVSDMEAIKGAGVVIEAIVEDASVKKQLFVKLAQMFTHQEILASNTSSISITELAAAAGAAAPRVVGMHFFNPVPVMKLVEVIKGLQTSPDTTERVLVLARQMGKTPIPANDRPGFVSNRVLMPMINEAVFCLMEGVATKEAIDTVMKLGMNHPMGPLTLADFIGLDVCLAILEVMHDGLGDPKYRPCPLLRRMVAAGRLGRKSGQGFYVY
jgi:3-hydroxybutyryl-CoA dehydrogenase